jgi:hypothetical protein
VTALLWRHEGPVHERTEITRTVHHENQAQLETWTDGVRVTLEKNGDYKVFVGEKTDPRTLIAEGNLERCVA